MIAVDAITRRVRGTQFLLFAFMVVAIARDWASEDLAAFSLPWLIVRLVGLIVIAILFHAVLIVFLKDTFTAINREDLLREARKKQTQNST
jgi:hypothetical protein